MTTIVYSHKYNEVVYDSRQTMGNVICNDKADKKIKSEHGIFFLAGATHYCEFLANNYPECKDENSSVYGIMISSGVAYWIVNENGRTSCSPCKCDMTAGSGEAYAQAALDFGMSAHDAVKYAMKRDCKTGGRVRVFKIK